jgi:hypothetical protein
MNPSRCTCVIELLDPITPCRECPVHGDKALPRALRPFARSVRIHSRELLARIEQEEKRGA